MSALDSLPLDTLSDSDAISLLFELGGHGDESAQALKQLDAEVYARLAQAYGDESPAPGRDD
jgi:hypothetical protein